MKYIKPDPIRIKEIDAALRDSSGKRAWKLLLKYLYEEW